jgi:hypothetical protein
VQATKDDRSNKKSRGRKKDEVSKSALKDSIHANLSLAVQLIIFNVKEQQEMREGKALQQKTNKMKQMTMTHNKPEGLEAVRATLKHKQHPTIINSTTYLPCGERERLNVAVDPPKPPS